MSILKLKLYERLQQYRVDFVYSSKNHFMAGDRCKSEEEKAINQKKNWEIGSIVVSIFAGLGCFGAVLSETHWEVLAGVLSFFSTGISIYTLTKNIEIMSAKHYQQADAYLALSKTVKNLEAQAEDGLLTAEKLQVSIEQLQHEQEKLQKNQLAFLPIDYEKAKKAIEAGQTTHTKTDFKNT